MDDLPHFKPDNFRLLFLDIDDVLNSLKTCAAYGRYPFPATMSARDGIHPTLGYQTNKTTFLDHPPVHDVEAFDRINIVLVNKLCICTDTHIVLSSTWRLGLDVDDVRDMLDYIGINRDRVIGRTCSGHLNWNRGREIQSFLQELDSDIDSLIDNGFVPPSFYGKSLKPTSYVILDDSGDMLDEQKDNFVQVLGDNGLRLEDVQKAGEILAGPTFHLGTPQ